MNICGAVHGTNAAPSSEHSNVTPAAGEPKVNDTSGVVVVPPAGPSVIIVSGVDESTVHSWLAGVGSTLPAASTVRTVNACRPSVTPNELGEVHGAYVAASSLHSNVTGPSPGSEPENSSCGITVLSSSGGPNTICVSGGVASTFHVALAGVSSTIMFSAADTSKVCSPSPTVTSIPDWHADGVPPSTEHTKPFALLVAWKVKLTFVWFVSGFGDESRTVSGASFGPPSSLQPAKLPTTTTTRADRWRMGRAF